MIPIRDINPTRRFPLVTVGLIVINFLVFLYELSLNDPALNQLIMSAGIIPYQVTNEFGPDVALDFITSMFLHGGWMHLLSNMLYLWIFGNNVEDRLGRVRFTFFYLICGILAGLGQTLAVSGSPRPTIGASGAIAGVLGAYLVLYPDARVQSIVLLFYFVRLIEIPAVIVLGMWFILQFFNGLASLGVPDMGGVAYFAHIGGFVAGIALIYLFKIGTSSGPPQRPIRRRNIFEDEFPNRWR
jgi:membrane associated rhomboid family serine protease